jgi:hypothetical protein
LRVVPGWLILSWCHIAQKVPLNAANAVTTGSRHLQAVTPALAMTVTRLLHQLAHARFVPMIVLLWTEKAPVFATQARLVMVPAKAPAQSAQQVMRALATQ